MSPTIHDMILIKTFYVNPPAFLDNLREVLNKLNIPIEYKTLGDISEVKYTYIFNCTGLGSREVSKDEDSIPICGHAITLNN